MSAPIEPDLVLVLAMPLRHIESSAEVCDAGGAVVLPAGGPGDIDRTPAGTRVLVIATDAGDAEVPAATWEAVFAGRVPHEPGEPWPAGVSGTWAAEHTGPDAGSGQAPGDPDEEEDEDEVDLDVDDEEDGLGPQSFLRVSALAPMARGRWVFANELVPKQRRGGRSFVPRSPRLLPLVD